MDIFLQRTVFNETETIGELYIGDEFECYTLEDKVRELPWLPVSAWKIKGETAIPCGDYEVDVTWSPRFQQQMPILKSVSGYSGVRIHPGNTHEHTEGCILPGKTKWDNGVGGSRLAYEALFEKIRHALFDGDYVEMKVRGFSDADV